jgi:thiazole/oxazole-forming peptide maturase SagD family component
MTFGTPLHGPAHAALRAAISKVAVTAARSSLIATTVAAMLTRTHRRKLTRRADGRSYLLLDFQRLFLYEEPADADGVTIESVVRFIGDGYPCQPASLFVNGDAPYRFLYPLDTLDILAPLLAQREPGVVWTIDLVTAEISRANATAHPEVQRRSPPPRDGDATVLRLRDCWTDASLRTLSPAAARAALDDLVSRALGPIRECRDFMDHASLPITIADLSWDLGRRKESCFGKSLRAGDTEFVALCEALERFQVVFQSPAEDDALVFGSYADLRDRAIDPRALFYRATDESRFYWTSATDLQTHARVLVPAQEIWFNTDRLPGETLFIKGATNGCATGGAIEEATLFALLEAIERDAYLTMWYLRRPCARIDLDSIEDERFQLLRRRWEAAFDNYSLQLFDITTDVGVPTVAGLAVRTHGEGPRTFHSAAARLTAERACFVALKDLTGFVPNLWPNRRADALKLLQQPELIVRPQEHFELYGLDESFASLAFLANSTAVVNASTINRDLPRDRYNLREVIEQIVGRLHAVGVRTLAKDVTHAFARARGLVAVKVVTPGLFPMWFGSRGRRLGITDRLRRLSMAWTGRAIASVEDCNLDIHPFS